MGALDRTTARVYALISGNCDAGHPFILYLPWDNRGRKPTVNPVCSRCLFHEKAKPRKSGARTGSSKCVSASPAQF